MFCNECGSQLSDQQRFCNQCGTRVTAGVPASQAGKQDVPPAGAEDGDAQAQAELGKKYFYGINPYPEDYDKARKCFEAAAAKGNAMGIWGIAALYLKGHGGLPKDEKKALDLCKQAIKLGSIDGIRLLGAMHRDGEGVPKNDAEACRLFRLAADQGDARAQSILGWMYEKGRGVGKNDVEACRLYHLAANQGHAQAQYYLADMYEYGKGVPKDIAEASELYKQAALKDPAYLYQKAWFFKRQGNYNQAVLDWNHYYKNHSPEGGTEDEIADWMAIINEHLKKTILPQIKANSQTFIYSSPCFMVCNYRSEESLTSGTSYTHRYGTDGTGYFVITDKCIYLCAFKKLSVKYRGVRKNSFIGSFLGNTSNHFKTIEEDMSNFITYTSIKSYSTDKEGSLVINAGNTTWLSDYYNDDVQVIMAAIDAAKNGAFTAANPEKPANDPVELLKKLKILVESGILSDSEYQEKKNKILADMGL